MGKEEQLVGQREELPQCLLWALRFLAQGYRVLMKKLWILVIVTFREWRKDKANRLAAALSFYTVISIAPLLILTLTITGYAFKRQVASQQLTNLFESVIGIPGAEVLTSIISNAEKPQTAGFSAIIGLVILLWGASNVFAQLHGALNTVWGVEPSGEDGFWVVLKGRVLAFGMVLSMGLLLGLSLILSSLLTFISQHYTGILPDIWLWRILNYTMMFLLVTLLFGLIYKVLPNAKIAWKDVFFGATLTSLLFTVGVTVLSFYFGMRTVGSAYGAAGSLVVFLFWVYFSAQIFLFGAEFTQVFARTYGEGITPAQHAHFTTKSASKDTRWHPLS